MKTKNTIKLFATAILATTTISAVNIATHPSDVFASEVTQIPNKNNVGFTTIIFICTGAATVLQ